MTFLANRLPRSSGNSFCLCVIVFIGHLYSGISSAETVIQKTKWGHIDWSTGSISVTGVGTPRILSATAGVTDESLTTKAMSDGHARLQKILNLICPDEADVEVKTGSCRRAAEFGRPETPMRMSDGTVHQTYTLDFERLLDTDQSKPRPMSNTGYTSLVIHLENPQVDPGLKMNAALIDGTVVQLGAGSSHLGRTGLRWLRAPLVNSPVQKRLFGDRPLVAQGRFPKSKQANQAKKIMSLLLSSEGVATVPPGAPVILILPKAAQ